MGFILILSLLCGVGKCVSVDKNNINITNISILSIYVYIYKGEVEVLNYYRLP